MVEVGGQPKGGPMPHIAIRTQIVVLCSQQVTEMYVHSPQDRLTWTLAAV